MNKPLSLVLVVGGIILITYGVGASHSVSSSLSHMFNGTPTDRTIWLMFGGTAAVIVGLVGFLGGSKSA
jgi:hypothetical protein